MNYIKFFESTESNFLNPSDIQDIEDILLDLKDDKIPYQFEYFYLNNKGEEDWHHEIQDINIIQSILICSGYGSFNKYHNKYKEMIDRLKKYAEVMGFYIGISDGYKKIGYDDLDKIGSYNIVEVCISKDLPIE